jgi:hypothetical protein
VQRAPGIPHALCFLGRKIHQRLGRIASRDREVAFDEHECATLSAVIARHRVGASRRPMTGSGGRSKYSEASVIESRSRSVLDTPRSMTTRCGAARRLANPRSVIPGRCEASNPESRDSGSGADAPSRNDGVWIFAEPVIGRAFARPPDLELRQRASHLSEEPGGIKN